MDDRLQKFARLVELGTFTRAASDLHISQPALSAAIKKLERELKQPLIERGSHPLRVTPAGQYAYTAAKELSVITSNLTFKLGILKRQKPHISIGLVDSVATTILTYDNFISKLEKSASISLAVNNSRYLVDAVMRNELDMALVVESPSRSSVEHLYHKFLGSEPLVIVCHKDHYNTAQKAIAKGELTPFISYDQHSNSSRLIDKHFIKASIRVRPTFYSTSPELMLQLIVANRGTGVVPYLTAKDMLAKSIIVPLEVSGSCIIQRRIALIMHDGKVVPTFLKETISQISTTLRKVELEAVQIDKQNHPAVL